MNFNEQEIRALCQKILGYSTAEQSEVFFNGTHGALTRFAVNHIHQNVAEENAEVNIRVTIGKRIGVASTNALDDASLQSTVEKATLIARMQPENPEWHSLPAPQPITYYKAFSETTAGYTPESRAEAVRPVIQLAKERGFEAAGAFETNVTHVAIANSLGVWAYEPRTESEFHAVVMADGDGSGWTQRMSTDAGTFDFEAMAREAVDKATRSRNPIIPDIGEYETILEPYAVADLLQNFAFMGINAMAQREGSGPLVGRIGQQVADPRISIYDDPGNSQTEVMSFDFEGQPIQRVAIIDEGVAKGVVYDSFNAFLDGHPNTGHALLAPNRWGPMPLHLAMAAGDTPVDEMIKKVQRGIYVTRFHYTNVVHPVKAIFTGMTRDGTFLIENGEITRPVRPMRFVQGIFDAFNSVRSIGRDRYLGRDYVPMLTPALHVGAWSFTGVQREGE